MSEQELREYVKAWATALGGVCIYGDDYAAHIVMLDDDTIAMRIMRSYLLVSAWGIYSYARAASVLTWADNGGNWKSEVKQ